MYDAEDVGNSEGSEVGWKPYTKVSSLTIKIREHRYHPGEQLESKLIPTPKFESPCLGFNLLCFEEQEDSMDVTWPLHNIMAYGLNKKCPS